MSYMPRPQAPKLSPRQAARVDAWNRWNREQERLAREAIAAFQAGDMDKFQELDMQRQSNPEPDIFNG